MTNKQANEILRQRYLKLIKDFLIEQEEDVNNSKSNEINLPTINENGSEEWVTITIRVPNGSRDGEAYDGYGEREDYLLKIKKAKEREEEKKKKLEQLKKKKKEEKEV